MNAPSNDLEVIRRRIADLRLMTDSRLSNAKRHVIAQLLQYAQAKTDQLAALREHTLEANPAMRTLHSNAVAYLDAVAALQEVRGAPLSTSLAWLIRQGYLVPADFKGDE